MLPIPENYKGSPCEIKAMDNRPITTGYVIKISDNEILIENKADSLPTLHCNTTIRINIFNHNLGFRVLVGKVYLSSADFLRISDVQSETDYEKRNFFRVKVEMKAKAFLEDDEGMLLKGSTEIPIYIKDLSLSGLYFMASPKLNIGKRLCIQLKLHTMPISLNCKIVRKLVTVHTLENQNGYGCEFLDNAEPVTEFLCKYLFDCQREQIRIMKERQL